MNVRWYGMRGEYGDDPFSYQVPAEVRGKVCHVFGREVERLGQAVGSYDSQRSEKERELVRIISLTIAKSFGWAQLPSGLSGFDWTFQNFIYSTDDKNALRAIEVTLNTLSAWFYSYRHRLNTGDAWLEKGIEPLQIEINDIFRNHASGYQVELFSEYPNLRIVRMDSTFLHEETVRKPLALLRNSHFDSAAIQFEEAVIQWSQKNYRNAITDANSAFESVMKLILGRDTGTAHQLIAELQGRYLPKYLSEGLEQLSSLMHMLPRLRNNEGDSHGRLEVGEEVANLARLAINLAGSYIMFLVTEWQEQQGATLLPGVVPPKPEDTSSERPT